MATASQDNLELYLIGRMRGLSAEEQWQYITFSTELLNTGAPERIYIDGVDDLSAEQTTTLLNDWATAANVATLNYASIQRFNFSTDDAAQAMANLVDAAVSMTSLSMYYQDDVRPIRIDVTPASQSYLADGMIYITEYDDQYDVILSMATSRTTDLSVSYGL